MKLITENLVSFVQARSLTSSSNKGVQIPAGVGNVKDSKEMLENLHINPDAKLDSREDCLVLRAHQLTSVVELPSFGSGNTGTKELWK